MHNLMQKLDKDFNLFKKNQNVIKNKNIDSNLNKN